MKTFSKIVLMALILLHTFAYAETGIEVKLGLWQSEFSGDIGVADNSASFDDLGYDDNDQTTLMATLRHPVPILPNVRLQMVELEADGSGDITGSLELQEEIFINETIDSSIDLSYTDVTLFYSPFASMVPLDVAIVDIGLTARHFDGSISASGSISNTDSNTEFDVWLPLLHLGARFELPFTGFYADVAGNIISVGDNSVTDLKAAAGYALSLPVVDVLFELGLQSFSIEAEDIDDVDDQKFDLDIDGVYFNVGLKL